MKAAQARAQGDFERADMLAPPSEKRIREDERCGALTQTESRCRQRKGMGTDHLGYGNCSSHGGNTQAGVKAAMREMGRDLIQSYKEDFLRFGGDRRDPSVATLTPEQALLEEVRRSAAMVRFLEERIATWNLSAVDSATIEAFAAEGRRKKTTRPDMREKVEEVLRNLDPDNPDSPAYLPALTHVHPKSGLTSYTDAREWLYLYREERGHLARVAKMSIDAGVAQRLVTIAEDQGRILASAIRVILQALNLSPEQASLVPQVVPPVLRAVAADQPIPDISSLALNPATT